jgi:hypothetical protein
MFKSNPNPNKIAPPLRAVESPTRLQSPMFVYENPGLRKARASPPPDDVTKLLIGSCRDWANARIKNRRLMGFARNRQVYRAFP